jgi:predicted ATP-grasp superfamily ATP-dependent carboligase
MTHVVVAGVSTRAAAESAARAGFRVTALDGYADRDQHAGVRALSLPRDFGVAFDAAAAAATAASIPADAVTYLSNFENHPNAVAALATHRHLWGNPPAVLRRARDPFALAALFHAKGFRTPRVLDGSNPSNISNESNQWLVKPLSSGGGHGIHPYEPDQRIRRGFYLQQRISGTSGSIVFIAASGRVAPLGVSRQLIGDARFGAAGYRYTGSILAPASDPQFEGGTRAIDAARLLAAVAAAELGLVGVNGIDFVMQGDVAFPIEVNPRWSASIELVERACAVNVFAAHARACTGGTLAAVVPSPARAAGKAIVFARQDAVAGNTDAWLGDPDIRDIPHEGDRIAAGSPVCTVFADADDAAACESELVRRADRIYRDLDRWTCASAPPFTIHDSRFTIPD